MKQIPVNLAIIDPKDKLLMWPETIGISLGDYLKLNPCWLGREIDDTNVLESLGFNKTPGGKLKPLPKEIQEKYSIQTSDPVIPCCPFDSFHIYRVIPHSNDIRWWINTPICYLFSQAGKYAFMPAAKFISYTNKNKSIYFTTTAEEAANMTMEFCHKISEGPNNDISWLDCECGYRLKLHFPYNFLFTPLYKLTNITNFQKEENWPALRGMIEKFSTQDRGLRNDSKKIYSLEPEELLGLLAQQGEEKLPGEPLIQLKSKVHKNFYNPERKAIQLSPVESLLMLMYTCDGIFDPKGYPMITRFRIKKKSNRASRYPKNSVKVWAGKTINIYEGPFPGSR